MPPVHVAPFSYSSRSFYYPRAFRNTPNKYIETTAAAKPREWHTQPFFCVCRVATHKFKFHFLSNLRAGARRVSGCAERVASARCFLSSITQQQFRPGYAMLLYVQRKAL